MSAEAVTTTPFMDAARDYIARGFHVVPIEPGKKSPGERIGASWRPISEWQRFRDRYPSPLELDIWASWSGIGIGIVLGGRVGDHQVIGVDVDVSDQDALREILAALPYTPMAKVGRKGQTNFYRAPADMRSRQYAVGSHPNRHVLADLLTGNETKQTVVPPSTHPDTGKPYRWVAGSAGVRADDLPVFSLEDLAAFEETLEQHGWKRAGERAGRETVNGTAPNVLNGLNGPFADLNAEALNRLDDWVPLLDLYGLKHSRGGYRAVPTWRESSSGRHVQERAPNLSITPAGIRDHGADVGYSAIDLVMAAKSAPVDQAFTWLDEVLRGPVREAYIPKAPVEVPPHDPETGEVIEEAPLPVVAAPPAFTTPVLSDDDCFPEGLVGEIAVWICETARRPQPILALAAALCVVGTAMGRQYAGPTRSGTHLYALGLSPSGGGKNHPMNQCKRILTAAGFTHLIGPSEFISATSLVNHLAESPLSLCCQDEFAVFLGRINSRKAGGFEKAVGSLLRSAWGESWGVLNTPAYAQKKSQVIYSPALSIFGVSTPDEFFSSLTGMDIQNGTMNRMIIFPSLRRVKDEDPLRDPAAVPESITAGIRRIALARGEMYFSTMNQSDTDMAKTAFQVRWGDDGAHACYKQLTAHVEHLNEYEAKQATIWARSAEYAIRIATIHAVGLGDAGVHSRSMVWADRVTRALFEYTTSAIGDYMAETESQMLAKEIIRIVKAAGGKITHRNLIRALDHKHKPRDLKDSLDSLVNAGALEAEEERTGSRGPRAIHYFIRRA